MSVHVGEIVRSLRGHDEGDCFYVLAVREGFLYLADGKRRLISAPKKKRKKHAASQGIFAHPVTDRIQGGGPVLDSEIRKALAAFRDKKFSETSETKEV